MKKAFSCLLAVLLMYLTAITGFSSETNTLHILVTTDIHTSVPPETITVTNDSLYANARDKGNMFDESAAILATFLDAARTSDAQAVLICGDLTEGGTTAEYEQAAQMLRQFEQDSKKSVFVVPGNHEGHSTETSREIFKSVFHDFGFAEALETDAQTCSYTVDLNGKYRLLALDSVVWGACRDGIDARLKNWIKAQAEKAHSDGKHLIAMMHHPLMTHFTLHDVVLKEFMVQDWQKLSAFFADNGIQYVFTGHEHSNDIASFTSKAGNTVYDVLTTSLNFHPVVYRDVTFSDTGVQFKLNTLEKILHTELLPNGYSAEQYAALTGDLQSYAYGYFNKCIELTIKYYLDADTLCTKLGTNNTMIRNALKSVLPRISYAMFEQPLYGENSLSAFADRHGTTIPESEHKTLWDACTALAKVHYCGDEHVSAFDPKAQIVIKGLGTTFAYAMRGIPADIQAKIFGEATERVNLNALLSSLPNLKDGAYTFVTALVSPIIEGVISDRDVPDNNVTLPAYQSVKTLSVASLFNYFTAKLHLFFQAILRILFGAYQK